MADEQSPVENLILVRSVCEPAYTDVTLFPKAMRADVIRIMGHPTSYTCLYSMTHMIKDVMHTAVPGYRFMRQTERSPYMLLDFFETKLRTKWLGKAPETIDEEIKQINEMMEGVKSRSSNIRFPSRLPGESS